jgi:hypothetical protein
MPVERRGPAARDSFVEMGGRGEMTKAPINLQDLRQWIYVKAKADSAGSGGVGAVQERAVREIRTLRARRRGLETESRIILAGHAGGNPGYRQGRPYGPPRQSSTLPGGAP